MRINLEARPPRETPSTEFVSIPELARRTGLATESVYRLARAKELPGCVQMGRRYIVNWNYFVEVSKAPITPAA